MTKLVIGLKNHRIIHPKGVVCILEDGSEKCLLWKCEDFRWNDGVISFIGKDIYVDDGSVLTHQASISEIESWAIDRMFVVFESDAFEGISIEECSKCLGKAQRTISVMVSEDFEIHRLPSELISVAA